MEVDSGPENDIDKLHDLLNGALFKRVVYTQIRQIISRPDLPHPEINNPENEKLFPELNLPLFREYARGWAEDFSELPIEKIILRRTRAYSKIKILNTQAMEKEGREPRKPRNPKYEIVFVLPKDSPVCQNSVLGMDGEEALAFSLSLVRGESTPSPMQTFLSVIEYERSSYDDSSKFEYLMPEGQFETVYRQPQTSSLWRDDWRVILCRNPDELNVILSSGHVVLFTKSGIPIHEYYVEPSHPDENIQKTETTEGMNTSSREQSGLDDLYSVMLKYRPDLEDFYSGLKNYIKDNINNGDIKEDSTADTIKAMYIERKQLRKFRYMTLNEALKGEHKGDNPPINIKMPILIEMIKNRDREVYIKHENIFRKHLLYPHYNKTKKMKN